MINSLISTLNIIITHKLNKLYLLNCTFTLMSYRAKYIIKTSMSNFYVARNLDKENFYRSV